MLLKNLSFFGSLPFGKSQQISKQFAPLILMGIFFILMLTLLGLAFTEWEYEEFALIESGMVSWQGFSPLTASLVVFPLAVFALILFFEYVRSHIGEKRFADMISEVFALFLMVCFYDGALRAVVCVHGGGNQ